MSEETRATELAGRTLSHYRILEPLGSGGMGEVYRARDTRLERDVAVKVLPGDAFSDESARRRFRKEALALSRLNHPNIGTIHDFDSQEGIDFLVMELIPGVTLDARLARGAASEQEAARIGEQIAEGLAAAHDERVVHRDIKPGNVRVTPGGRVKIIDFGLAKRVPEAMGATTTESAPDAGGVAGTLPYMSPEQMRGEQLDGRTDIYSLGALLYELATGHRPFPEGSAPRLIGAILGEPPRSPRAHRASLSTEFERIVLKCLEKDPADRYQSARELAVDLRRVSGPGRAVSVGRPRGRRARLPATAWAAGGATLVVALVALSLNLGGIRERILRTTTTSTVPSLAVLPLVNLSGNPNEEYFADGVTDELITRLAQIQALKVISRASAMHYKGTKKTLPQIAKELGVRMLLEGTVRQSGNRVRISAELVDARTQRSLWAETFEQSLTDILVLQSEIAQAIVGHLSAQLTPEEHSRIAVARQVNPEAYAEYLKGQDLVRSGSPQKWFESVTHFTRAIGIDPGFAAAHAGLAAAYQSASTAVLPPNEAMPRARASARRALELDSTLVEARATLAYVTAFYDWRWTEAETEMRLAIDRFPGDAHVHSTYGFLLTVLGRFAEAEREFTKAEDLDPLGAWVASLPLIPIYNARRYDAVVRAAREKLRTMSDLVGARHILAQALLMKGDSRGALDSWDTLRRSHPDLRAIQAWEAYGYGISGQRAKARAIAGELEKLTGEQFVGAYYMAVAYAGMGDRDRAFAWLERGLEDRTEDMMYLKVEPAWDVLRSDPRFGAILRKMGFRA